jgi:tetratricopeptide (TPR) repeat protein
MIGEGRKEPEMRTIVFVDAVNFTSELKSHGRSIIAPKIKQLKEFTEFFFVYKLKGRLIGQMGDGFLVLCPPTPTEVITEALSCLSFVSAYNFGQQPPTTLNTRIAIHFGMISPPERGNYIDTNLNLTARLEGATPPNTVCISSSLYDIVADTLREITFEELKSDFKGLGENKYYKVSKSSNRILEPTRRESRLSFYFATIDALRETESWDAVRTTCEQALMDFPDNPEFITQLGYSLFELDDYIGAIRAFEKCINLGYNIGQSLYLIGLSNGSIGNEKHALEVFQEAVENDSSHFHALGEIASIYLKRGNYEEADKWAKKSFRVNPRFIIPIAIQIVIRLIKREDNALIPLIRKIEPARHSYLREYIQLYLKGLRKSGYGKKLGANFTAARSRTTRNS